MSDSGPLGSTGASPAFREAAALLAEPWPPVVLRQLADSDGLTFEALAEALPELTEEQLGETLSALEATGGLEQVEISSHPPEFAYVLTDRGAELEAVCQQLADWVDTAPEAERIIVVADDDRRVATMHTAWLSDAYAVRTAHDGEEAIEMLGPEVDVCVLDRRMPRKSGDEVLAWLREQGYDTRVVMITAEEPGEDLFDLDFDEYLTKPVSEAEFKAVVADLIERGEYDSQLQAYLARQSTVNALQAADDEEPDDAVDDNGADENVVSDEDAVDDKGTDDMIDDTDAVDDTDDTDGFEWSESNGGT
ncbi:response regulator [Halonotius roseus]|uniref:Response regulator n=1 Tax=Halonotius roseus TaxID=2511997 RepID=A0A544QL58_9EURY|nr:response regulator [Halonotius roseus]TQQ79106.1 response regulator [Halonotius roseus]